MSLIDLTNYPTSLKKLIPYITRANEVSKRNPNVAYFCLTYAMEIGVKLSKNLRSDKPSMNALVSLMDTVENLKKTLNPNVEEGRALMELYSMKVFNSADHKEQSGDLSKTTMVLYLMSSYLMETTKQFSGGISPDIQNKQKYARWRVMEIRKKMKGLDYEPAPKSEEEEVKEETTEVQQEDNNSMNFFNTLGNTEPQQSSPPSQPTQPTNFGFSDSSNNQNNEEYDPLEQIKRDIQFSEEPKNEEIPFWMKQNNEETTTSNFTQPEEPPKVEDFFSRLDEFSNHHEQPKVYPKSNLEVKKKKEASEIITVSPTPNPVYPKPREISKPQVPIFQNTSGDSRKIAENKTVDESKISTKDLMSAQKFAKFAASSLQFDDIKAARKYLIDALNLLGGI